MATDRSSNSHPDWLFELEARRIPRAAIIDGDLRLRPCPARAESIYVRLDEDHKLVRHVTVIFAGRGQRVEGRNCAINRLSQVNEPLRGGLVLRRGSGKLLQVTVLEGKGDIPIAV
jgi:hypothetical protein